MYVTGVRRKNIAVVSVFLEVLLLPPLIIHTNQPQLPSKSNWQVAKL